MTTPYFCEGSDAMVELETMVDRVGLANVLYALEHICYGKAEHVLTTWQDTGLHKAWNFNGNACCGAAKRLKDTQ